MTATPWGFRDILPEEALAREEIAQTVRDCFRAHHYLPVETPLLEDKGSLEEGRKRATTCGSMPSGGVCAGGGTAGAAV